MKKMGNPTTFNLFNRVFHSLLSRRHFKRSFALVGLTLAVLLSACEIQAPPETVPVFVKDDSALVSVTGTIAPAVWTTVSPQTSGEIVEVLAEEGDQVAAGDVLARLDDTDARLAVRQAEAALAATEAQVVRARVCARPEEIAVAEAQVEAAQTVISQTLTQRDQLWTGAGEAEIAAAEAAVAAAQAEQLVARQRHDDTMKCHDEPQPDGSTKEVCPALGTAEEQARFALHAANKALAAAKARLEATKSGVSAQRDAAGASIATAVAQYEVALAQLELLKAGALPENIAIAETAVAQAKVVLETAKVALARTEITAPFAGTITGIDVRQGGFALPGQPLFTLGDLTTLRVETTDLDESDVTRITLGQAATLTFNALPDLELTGHIAHIAAMAEPGTGGVHYTVTLDPGELPPKILWGMTVFIDIDVSQ
jgi:HlyD family secretion protein